jgi:hypothetical protein
MMASGMMAMAMLTAAGCGVAGDEDPVASEAAAIQGGKKDAGDHAVGLVWLRGGGFCSGTLVAPDVVLTAGHCVEEPVAAFYTGAGDGAAEVGRLPAGGFVEHRVIAQVAHPSYRSLDQCPNPTFDVGLLRLAAPVHGAKPLALAAQPPPKGATCRAVGYGVHNQGDKEIVEQRRSATEEVLAVERAAVHLRWKSGVADHGDSGGPLLCGGHIVGVTSCGTDGAYPDHREVYDARVDRIADWIQQTAAAWK